MLINPAMQEVEVGESSEFKTQYYKNPKTIKLQYDTCEFLCKLILGY
jgi:hypothetical protein